MESSAIAGNRLARLDALLRPKSIAVVGASATPGKLGAVVLANILSNGYSGKVFPVNPSHPEIQGLKAYRSVLDVPGEIDKGHFPSRFSRP